MRNILMPSHVYRREVKNDVWKYLQNIFIGLYFLFFVCLLL